MTKRSLYFKNGVATGHALRARTRTPTVGRAHGRDIDQFAPARFVADDEIEIVGTRRALFVESGQKQGGQGICTGMYGAFGVIGTGFGSNPSTIEGEFAYRSALS